MKFPTPNRIREQLILAEKQEYLAKKKGDMGAYLYWSRKVQAGYFLLYTYPFFIVCLISSFAFIIFLGVSQ